MWLTRYTSRIGTAALAALGVGHKVEGLGFIAISGFALSASALVGQNLGAQQEARARQAVRMTVGYCLVATTVTAVAFLTIPETLVALFTPDPAVIADGSLYLRVIAFAQIGKTFEIILEGARGAVYPVARLAPVPARERAPGGRGPRRRHRPPRAGGVDRGTLLRRPGQRPAVVSAGGRTLRGTADSSGRRAHVPSARRVRAGGGPARPGRATVTRGSSRHRGVPLPAPHSPPRRHAADRGSDLRRSIRDADLEHSR